MRRFELILAFVAAFAVIWPAVFGVRPRRGVAAGLLTIAFILQLQIEGYRWQLLPIYLVSLGLAIGDVIYLERGLTWSRRLTRGLFGTAGLTLAAGLAAILPVPELPVPPGPQAIGTFTVELVDTGRAEAYGPSPGAPRRLMAQVWYPALGSGSVAALPWSTDWDVVAPATARLLGFPSWFLDHTRYTDSHATQQPPMAEGVFPIIVYSHGWTGFRSIAVNQIETLVSNGYIVIAPDHTFGSVGVRFPDGEVINHDATALPEEEEVGAEAYRDAAELLVETFADDIVTILDELDRGESGAFSLIWRGADLTRIGVYGHSTGGGAAVKVCLEDRRCDAVLGMDAWVEPLPDRVIRITASTPSLFMRSEDWIGTENDSLVRGIAGRSDEVSYVVGIAGAGHNDFVLTPLISPVAGRFGWKGPIPAGRIIPIVDNYLLGFFDVYLLGTGPATLDTVNFDEVSVEILNR